MLIHKQTENGLYQLPGYQMPARHRQGFQIRMVKASEPQAHNICKLVVFPRTNFRRSTIQRLCASSNAKFREEFSFSTFFFSNNSLLSNQSNCNHEFGICIFQRPNWEYQKCMLYGVQGQTTRFPNRRCSKNFHKTCRQLGTKADTDRIIKTSILFAAKWIWEVRFRLI